MYFHFPYHVSIFVFFGMAWSSSTFLNITPSFKRPFHKWRQLFYSPYDIVVLYHTYMRLPYISTFQIISKSVWPSRLHFSIGLGVYLVATASVTLNSPIHDNCLTQSAKVCALPWEQAHQDGFNDNHATYRLHQSFKLASLYCGL